MADHFGGIRASLRPALIGVASGNSIITLPVPIRLDGLIRSAPWLIRRLVLGLFPSALLPTQSSAGCCTPRGSARDGQAQGRAGGNYADGLMASLLRLCRGGRGKPALRFLLLVLPLAANPGPASRRLNGRNGRRAPVSARR